MRIIDELDIYANGQLVGELTKHPKFEGEGFTYSFQYIPGADVNNPISLLFPVRRAPYFSANVHPVFQSSLPEGFLRDTIEKCFSKAVLVDDMGALYITGQNRIGHLQCVEKGSSPSVSQFNPDIPDYDRFRDADIDQYINRIMSDYAKQSGVSGAMPKILTSHADRVFFNAKLYIIKMDSSVYPYVSANEYFCLSAARRSEMIVPDVKLIMNGRGLCITRFDVIDSGHQMGFEDACSLLGLENKFKYTASSEALARCIYHQLSNHTTCVSDSMARLFKATLFSHAIRNSDAHLKNYGILFNGNKSSELSPIYDLVTTTAYPHLAEDSPALTLNGKKTWCNKRDFLKVGESVYNLSHRQVESIFSDVERGVNATSDDVVGFLNEDHPQEAATVMTNVLKSWETGLLSLDMNADQVTRAIEQIEANQRDSQELR